MGTVSQIMVFTSITFLHPILSPKLEDEGYSVIFIGTCFAIPTLVYAGSSPLIFMMTTKVRKAGVIFLGYLIVTIAMFLIGPSKVLNLPEYTTITLAGLTIFGLGCGMIIIPVLPDMIEATEQRHPGTDMDQLHNSISGLFIAAQGLGETLGPILGSIFENKYTFRPAVDLLSIILFSFMIIYFFVCGRLQMFEPPIKHEKVIDSTKSDKINEPLIDKHESNDQY
jgi:MFS family permease